MSDKNTDITFQTLKELDDFLVSFFLDLRSFRSFLSEHFILHDRLINLQEFRSIDTTFLQRIFHLVGLGHQLENIDLSVLDKKGIHKNSNLLKTSSNFFQKQLFQRKFAMMVRRLESFRDLILGYEKTGKEESIDKEKVKVSATRLIRSMNLIITRLNVIRKKEYTIYHLHHAAEHHDPLHENGRNYLLHIAGGMGKHAGREGFKEFVKSVNSSGKAHIVFFTDGKILGNLEAESRPQESDFEEIERKIREFDAKGIYNHEFEVIIEGKNYLGIFTNDERSKIIANRQDWFLKFIDGGHHHYTDKDYVYGLKKVISKYNASLVYILCNLASAPKELLRLSHLTHSFVFIYDLPGGLIKRLSAGERVCFLSTLALYKTGTYQTIAKNKGIYVYEIDKKEPVFRNSEGINFSKDKFYQKINDDVIGKVKEGDDETAGDNFEFYLKCIHEDEGDKISPIKIGLCCTELPLARDAKYGDNFPYFVDKETGIEYAFVDP